MIRIIHPQESERRRHRPRGTGERARLAAVVAGPAAMPGAGDEPAPAGHPFRTGYQAQEIIGHPVAVLHTEEDVRAGLPGQELAAAARDGPPRRRR